MTEAPLVDVVIVGAARTPFGKLLGGLSPLSAPELGAHAIAAALRQAEVEASAVEAVILGQVLQAGVGQNPAKQAALAAGIPPAAHTATVNKVCLSGLTAIIDAARLIRAGEAEVVVAGGMESMSRAPHLLTDARGGRKFGALGSIDHMEHDGLRAADLGISMGELSERYAACFPATREEQDACALASHVRADEARKRGDFATEIAPVAYASRKAEVVVDSDEGIRPDATADSLAGLPAVFAQNGTLTAGNSSPLSDGAAAVVLTTRAVAQDNGWPVMAALRAPGQVAGPDSSLQAQPARALEVALARQGWSAADLDHVEINEAFAAVVVHSARELGLDLRRVNPQGGAIALGHPIGASGARLVVHAAHRLAQGHAFKAGVALCGGGGQGEALLLEA